MCGWYELEYAGRVILFIDALFGGGEVVMCVLECNMCFYAPLIVLLSCVLCCW